MNKTSLGNNNSNSFWKFVFIENRFEFIVLSSISFLLFGFFAYSYPSPVTTIDTPNYVWCAITNEIGAYRPFGYSAFIRLTGFVSHSFLVFSFLQFIIHYISISFFIYTIKFHFKPTRNFLFIIFALLTLCSNAFVYLSFWLMSDSVFISLTILWIATLIWSFYSKNIAVFIVNILLLFFLMKIRYTGSVYPLIAILSAFIYFKQKVVYVILISIVLFITVYKQGVDGNKRFVGVDTFSGFTGWAKANNATCILPYVDIDTTKFKSDVVRRIHQVCKAYPDSFYSMKNVEKTAFMWYNHFPGKAVLMEYYTNNQGAIPYVKCWAYMGTKMNEYSNELIAQHPLEFTKRFVFWNTLNLASPMNNFDKYPKSDVDQFTKEWFRLSYKTHYVKHDIYGLYLSSYNYLKYVISFILGIIAIVLLMFFKNKFSFNTTQNTIIFILNSFTLITGIFLIICHPIHLRYVIMFSIIFFSLFYIVLNSFKKSKS